jgi:uncharacterized protein YcgI (DUF1989 family)
VTGSRPRLEHEIPSGEARAVQLAAGELLTVSSPEQGQGGDLSFPGFDQALTRNINGFERFGRPWLVFAADPGMSLYDGDGRAVLEVGECRTEGSNDIMYPGCWSGIYEDGRPGCRELISEALGIGRAELTGMLSFFVTADADPEGYRGLGPCEVRPGDFVSFRALVPTPVAVSACPDDRIEGWRMGPLRLTVAGS